MLSFEELYLVYSPDVYRFACWLSGDKPDAEDITSDTFVRAWMNVNNIRTETLKAYLFSIARTLTWNHYESITTTISSQRISILSSQKWNGSLKISSP